MSDPLILVVDDDEAVTSSLALLLKQAGHASLCAGSPEEALARLAGHDVSLVLQDMNFSRLTTGEEGLALLARVRELRPELPVILITAWGSIDLAVRGMKAGASDFIMKPWSNEQILQAVRTALGLAASGGARERRERITRAELDERYDLAGVIGESPRFLAALDLLGRVAATDASVLITGDSGTGKEVLAEVVHRNSPRRDGPLVKVNLGGIPTTLFESEMFGHVKGAFTDAHRDRVGRFASAEGGTIFLDEIGELDPRSQVKMLRVLQDRTYEVLGTSETRTLDVRVVSATNRDLTAAVESGEFREDLFYRLNLISVQAPALSERRDDVPLLARHFLDSAAREHGRGAVELEPDALAWLRERPWPGNVRQLQHLVERALLLSDAERLGAEQLRRTEEASGGLAADALAGAGSMTVQEMERAMILRSLEEHGGNLSRVAKALGLSRAALYRRLAKYGIET